ncbi:MAG: flagellar biosynthesis protein FliQ [Candidatus Kapaibacterium sp.]
MTEEMVINVIRDAFYYVMLICGPLLLASLIIGLIISIFQAATSISEQTLTFVPKVIAVFILTVLLMPFMISTMKAFTLRIFEMIETL